MPLREQLLQDEQNRFSEQRRELQRHLSYAETSAGAKREKEIRYNGLVVLRAYLGEKTQIRAIRRAIAKARLPSQIATSVETVADLEHQIS